MRFFVTTMLALAIAASLPAITGAQQLAPSTNQVLLQQLYLLPAIPLPHETDLTVGTSATEVLVPDPARVEDVVSNTGTSNCAIRHDPQVTITNGILLGSGGGTLTEDFRGDLSITTAQLWAICAAGGGTLHILTLDLQ